MNVVYFGASLTWGANASDPMRTSYRGHVSRWLEDRYPRTQFRFHDAAIGGTGSRLGVFRLQRDVLRHDPDLVLLDFTANDNITDADPDRMASLEALVRKLVGQAGVPVVINVFPFKGNVARGALDGMSGRTATIDLAEAYQLPVADAVAHLQAAVRDGRATVGEIWPWDGAHPGDRGYRLFAEAVIDALGSALERGVVGQVPPRMRYAPTYMQSQRVRLSSLSHLPDGWQVSTPSRVAAWYDGLMTRWLDDVVVATARPEESNGQSVAPEPLAVKFRGATVMLFGEETMTSGRYRVTIDGRPTKDAKGRALFDASARRLGGNRQHAATLATGLDPHLVHTLTITPILDESAEQELRIESICVAGGESPDVWVEQ